MNGLLRHTSNIHLGMVRSTKSYLGVVWNNIKAGFVFAAKSIGLIKNTNI